MHNLSNFCLKSALFIQKRNDFLVKSITFAPEIQTTVTAMTPNKQFNTYKEGLDLEFLREYCMEHGERRVMERGETLEEAGEPAQWVAFVERGCFKYMVHNDEEGKDYCTGFAFEGEFVADFPYCLDGDVSEVSIEADMPCEVRVISGQELQALFDNNRRWRRWT